MVTVTLELLQRLFYIFSHKTFPIVLIAVVDANYRFVMVDVGAPRRHSDGGVFEASEFGRQLGNETRDIPKLVRLSNRTKVVPYVYVRDEAFQLRPDFIPTEEHAAQQQSL